MSDTHPSNNAKRTVCKPAPSHRPPPIIVQPSTSGSGSNSTVILFLLLITGLGIWMQKCGFFALRDSVVGSSCPTDIMPDLALETLGGLIVSTSATSLPRKVRFSFLGLPIYSTPPYPPETIIREGVTPGECWGFEGKEGSVIIQIMMPANLTGITLHHIPKELDPYGALASAPKEFKLYGIQINGCLDNPEREFIGNFTFEPLKCSTMYYNISSSDDAEAGVYSQIELEVTSNHGANSTCIYQLSVHGNIQENSSCK